MTPPRADVRVDQERPTDDTVRAVLELVGSATQSDGVAPLSEQAQLRLRHRRPDTTTHAVARTASGDVVGYLQLTTDDSTSVAELVVAPTRRRAGIGTALAAWAMRRLEPSRGLRAWAHGDLAAAAELAAALGFQRRRTLLQLRRTTDLALPAVRVPAGVTIRTFCPGTDDTAWVEVNARAFAGHPEQGRLGLADLHERMAEPWFDAAGFFVAQRSGQDGLVGFHWTKVHGGSDPIGEVYVVGIDPAERGTGLGLALTHTGLSHLAAAGLPAVMLYADETNAGAVRMYERLGFTRTSVDVTYEH